jgi:hypothetical protein
MKAATYDPALALLTSLCPGDAAGHIHIVSIDGADITKNIITPFSSPSGALAWARLAVAAASIP